MSRGGETPVNWNQLNAWGVRSKARGLTFLPVTVVDAVGVTVESDATSPLSRGLVQSKDGDPLHHSRFLLQHL